MRFYNQTHQYYCGVDLHARSMYLHILDHNKQTVFADDLPASAVGSGQWAVGSGQWAVGSGQWAVGSRNPH